jgi:FKBP-type peptidyl-prolyl cis-trans isomerase FkpA
MNFFYLVIIIVLLGCSEKKESPQEKVKWTKEKSIELNKTIALEEKLAIKLFLAQHQNWSMIESGSGLQYFIYEKGNGPEITVGSVIDVAYSVNKLDGTLCYKTSDDKVVEIVVDHSQVETGIQECLKKMKEGDKAKMIIPSHLAHGLTGDMDKIPPLTPIVVDLNVIEILR